MCDTGIGLGWYAACRGQSSRFACTSSRCGRVRRTRCGSGWVVSACCRRALCSRCMAPGIGCRRSVRERMWHRGRALAWTAIDPCCTDSRLRSEWRAWSRDRTCSRARPARPCTAGRWVWRSGRRRRRSCSRCRWTCSSWTRRDERRARSRVSCTADRRIRSKATPRPARSSAPARRLSSRNHAFAADRLAADWSSACRRRARRWTSWRCSPRRIGESKSCSWMGSYYKCWLLAGRTPVLSARGSMWTLWTRRIAAQQRRSATSTRWRSRAAEWASKRPRTCSASGICSECRRPWET